MKARALVLAGALVAFGNCQQHVGSRAWECIAPGTPGGGWDLTCRSIAQVVTELKLSPSPMRVLNMPGAGGGVAFAHTVAQRHSDDCVLIAASPATTLRLAQRQYANLEEGDVRWVAALGAEYGILAVRPQAPWRSLRELMEAWKRDPRSIIVSGGSAVAGQDHMKVLLLAELAGLDPRRIRYVAFDGGGEAMTALLGGFVHVFSGEASEVEAQVEAGQLRVLTIFAPERLVGPLADVPTVRESGYDLEWITWRGFYVPGGITEEAYERWVQLMTEVGQSAAWEKVRASNRLQPFYSVGADFEALVKRQILAFRELSRGLGLIE
jgi:putative tricarboxylic transport membrane protein